MGETKHTSGPLFVRQPAKWPFRIEIVDAAGEVVHSEARYAYSTKHETIEDVMTAHGFHRDDVDAAVAGNERQLADAHLRAAAPDLLDVLKALHDAVDNYFGPSKTGAAWPKYFDAEMFAARAAISKALGETT
ncbi:MAG TPA: hypothetical protein VF783_13875 [Terriglobales bacterium]